MKKNDLLLWEFFYNFYKENIDEIESELKENGFDPEKTRQKWLNSIEQYYATLDYKKGLKLQQEAEEFFNNLSDEHVEYLNDEYKIAARKGDENSGKINEKEARLLKFLRDKKNPDNEWSSILITKFLWAYVTRGISRNSLWKIL